MNCLRGTSFYLTLFCALYPIRTSAESGTPSDSRALHNSTKESIDIVQFVLGGIKDLASKNGKHEVLVAAPTQGGGIRGLPGPINPNNLHSFQDSSYDGAYSDQLNQNNQNGFATFGGIATGLFAPDSEFSRGGGYRGGGYRGQKNLPVTPGGYRGGPLRPSISTEHPQPTVIYRPHGTNSQEKDIPLDQVIALPQRPPLPSRGSRDNGPWKPEVVVGLPQVIREDKPFKPAALVKPLQPQATRIPHQIKPSAHVNAHGDRPIRPPLVPVTTGGPPHKDYITQLEEELVAGLTPQQLKELSTPAIDPRSIEGRSIKNRVLFPGAVV